MPKTEAFLSQPRREIPGYVTEQEVMPVMSELRQQEELAQTRAGEAEVAIEEAKRREKGREAGMKAELVRTQAEELAALPEAEQLRVKRQELASAAFVPTRDNFNDIATLFSLVGVLGIAMGGGGRGAGLTAMNAMNGMVEGYRRGRADLYKQQLGEFDRSIKTMQQQIATLEKQYSEALKLKALDREAGELEIQQLLAASDSPVLKAMRDRQGDVAALNYIKNVGKDVQTAMTIRNNLQSAADQRKARADEAELNRQFRAEQDEIRREFTAGQNELNRAARREESLQKSEKLSPKEKAEVRGVGRLQEEIQLLRETFQPRFANYKLDVVGDVAAKVQSRLENDPAMAEWWRRYENVALPERHEMFGATLTGGEKESWRKASIGTGSSTAEILSWMGDKDRILNRKLTDYETRLITPVVRTGAASPGGAQSGAGVDVAGERQRANDAIARGANREAVAARFKQKTGEEL
jgi:hypothetical protein